MPTPSKSAGGTHVAGWRVYHANGSMGSGGHWGVEDERGAIARVYGPDGPTCRARANMIASAPSLSAEVAALRSALEAVVDCGDTKCKCRETARHALASGG